MIIQVDPEYPLRKDIKYAVNILSRGGVIAYPTDTIYGIGCDLMNKDAIEKIYRIRKLPKYKQLSFICQDIKQVSEYAQVSNAVYKIMKQLTPGPFTFILNASKSVPKIMMNKRREVGIRIADNAICSALIEELGNPIINTSASFDKDEDDEEEYVCNPEHIHDKFGNNLDLVIDGGLAYFDPSTIIDMTKDYPEIIRQGKGDASSIL